LRYKLTYIKIFETYLESESRSEVTQLLRTLITAQQAAIAPLSSYLRRLNVNIQDLALNQKLMDHAFSRKDMRSRLRFIHGGLERAVSWYQMQLVDRQMTADPELRQLLFELGETDAAKLWHVETVMCILKISVRPKKKDWDKLQASDTDRGVSWQSRLAEDARQPAWQSKRKPDWYTPLKSRKKNK
ncbi:MAG: hypothetical protein PVH17_13105, partial [Anaerolineae bacterium]